MGRRLLVFLAAVCAMLSVFAGVARALDFDDEDPAPVQTEVGRVLSYTIGTHAGCLPHHLVILSGALPPGTTLTQVNDHTGLVSGVPTTAGKYTVWMAVKDCANKSAESLFEFDVGERSFAIQTTSLPAASTGVAYTARLQAGGHAIRSEQWTLEQGTLPAGLTLGADGTISGTPSAPGTATFTVKVTSIGDDGATRVDTRQLTLTVAGALTFGASRRTAEVGVPFTATLSSSGGQPPLSWSATNGLPEGLAVNASGGVAGVPKRAGTYTVDVRFVDASGTSASGRIVLVVHPRLAIRTRTLRTAAAGHAYRAPVATRGGVTPLRWSLAAGKLPRGLKLGARTGSLAGKPGAAGTYRFTVRARDALGAVATKRFVLHVR